MKKIIFICFQLSLISAFAQKEFAPKGATWYYSKMEGITGGEGYIKMVSERDTIIDDKTSKILSQQYVTSNGEIEKLNDIYLHQQGDKIYYWMSNQFRLLYDFSVQQGDTMEIYSEQNFCYEDIKPQGYVKIDKVEEIFINDVKLKKISNTHLPDSPQQLLGPFVEILGGLKGFFPIENTQCLDYFSQYMLGNLRCYYDDSFGYYQVPISEYDMFPNSTICDKVTPIVEGGKDVNINVLYFDKTKTLMLEKLINQDVQIKLYDTQGKILLETKIDENNSQLIIPLQGNNAIYLLQIISNNEISTQKIYAY